MLPSTRLEHRSYLIWIVIGKCDCAGSGSIRHSINTARKAARVLRMGRVSKRINSSEKNQFYQISAPANMCGDIVIYKFDEGDVNEKRLGGVRVGVKDAPSLLIKILFMAGFDVKEVLAEICSQSFNVDRETIEALMRR